MKKEKKQMKKEKGYLEKLGLVGEGYEEVTDKEIKDLEKELKKLPDRDIPQPDYNKGMELILSAGNLSVFRNDEGVLYQMDISLETVEEGRVVLKKIKVVV